MAEQTTEAIYTKINYDISALPFDHSEADIFTVSVLSRPDGKWIVKSRMGHFVTKDGKCDNRRLFYDNRDLFDEHCVMTEEDALAAAKWLAPRLLVNNFTVDDVLAVEGMNAEEFDSYTRRVRKENQEKVRQLYMDTHLSEEDIAKMRAGKEERKQQAEREKGNKQVGQG